MSIKSHYTIVCQTAKPQDGVTDRDLRLLGCTHTKFLKINGIIGTGIGYRIF